MNLSTYGLSIGTKNYRNPNGTVVHEFNDTTSSRLISDKFREIEIWSILLGLMCLAGCVLNLLLLMTAWPQATRKSTFGLLICHFIAMNFVMCFVSLPSYIFLAKAKVDGRWIPSDICSYIRTLFSFTSFTVNWCDAELAVNRFVALFYPHHYAKLTYVKVNVAMITFAWLAGLTGVIVPLAIVRFNVITHINALGACDYSSVAGGPLGRFTLFFGIFVPYTISGVGAVFILVKTCLLMNCPSRIRPRVTAPSLASVHRLKMARMLLLTFLWTALCVAPGNIAVFLFGATIRQNPMILLWFTVAYVLQYGFTPAILLLSNDEYRQRLMRILRYGNSKLIPHTFSNTAAGSLTHP